MDYVGRVLPLGLSVAWVINDVEELFTMSQWTFHNAESIKAFPIRAPWPADGMSFPHVCTAIGIVGTGIASATAHGIKTRGRSRFYRTALLAFGLHGFTHLAQTLVFRQYTPGVITGVGVVIPFWLWAESERRRRNDKPYASTEIMGALGIIGSLPAIVFISGKISTRYTRRSSNH